MEKLESTEILCKGRGRCGSVFNIGEVDTSKIKIGDNYLLVECPRCGKNTFVSKKELGAKYDQLKTSLSAKIEKEKKKEEENFEIYYAEGDYDSIVVEGGLDRLKRCMLKDGLSDAEVPEKVIDRILRRWDQDTEIHKDYGRLVLMIQRYIQDLRKVNAGLEYYDSRDETIDELNRTIEIQNRDIRMLKNEFSKLRKLRAEESSVISNNQGIGAMEKETPGVMDCPRATKN